MDTLAFVTICDEFFNSYEAAESRTRNGYEKVYEKARQQISDARQVLEAVIYLRQKLVILNHHKKLDYSKYTPVLDSIRDVARKELDPSFTALTETNWDELTRVIIENRKELHYFESETHPQLESKLHTFAHSYLRLRNFGVEFIEDDYKFYISDNSYELINNEIDRICREYGGEELLSALADRLGRTYNAITGRFMEYRQVSMGTTEVHAAMPFGYLMAIASKCAGTRGNTNPGLLDRLLILIADIIVVYEIQPYSQYEAMYISEEGLIEFIRTNILYDSFVGVAQTKASYASSLIRFLQAKFDGARYESFGVPVKDVTRVALALISKAETKKFTTVSAKDLALKTRMPEFKVAAAMDELLSVASGVVNSGLQFPPSSMDIDHYFKPAIKIGKIYKVFPKSIASLGCVNTVCASIALPNGKWANEIDSELGYAIEEYLRGAFLDKGISIAYGDRLGGDSDLEVDLLCETDEAIYIFEMKKKGLTRQAQSGDQSKILADLADSVLASHFQAMRIENVLKNNDSLQLVHKGVKKTVCLNNRQVQRISVSLPDFGALQDKTVLQRLLTIAALSKASHPDKSEDNKLKKWRDYSEKLKDLAMANGELGKNRMPFHNSLFMSIPQIIMLLDKSENANEFFKHIKSFIGTTTGSRDTYTEFLNRLTFLDRCKAEGLPV
ncbi:hypothetical protein [Pseudomonas mandelii]|uniref:NERD domain-containing protein n=1 Tax=Pseudomonas mandelii TaxID=75612 RepID=A0A502IEC8_9PSED|nr:hypothetical protein [Pseudomonas mandelii]TPG84745.1 hypothetical protein EAH74_12015 [Pseudomonas mandelii]